MDYIKRDRWYQGIIPVIIVLLMTLGVHAKPIKMMFLGDSITSGEGSLPLNPESNTSEYNGTTIPSEDQIAYRGALWRLLKEAGYNVDNNDSNRDIDFVGTKTKDSSTFQNDNPTFDEDHEGHGGYTSSDIRENISGWLEQLKADDELPDIVLMHIGTNDPGKGIPILSEENATDDNNTVSNIKAILNTIFDKNSNAKVFVARIIEARRAHGFAGGLNGGAWKTEDLNDKIEEMVDNHSKRENIIMVDMQSGARLKYNPCGTELGDMQPFHIKENNETNETTYLYDYHPNSNGYKKIAKKWFVELNASKWLPDITPPVITLKGSNPQQLALNTKYEELGASASDNYDGNLTVGIDATDVNMSQEGNYTVIYSAADSAGNSAEVKRTIVVSVAPDTQAPIITLIGEDRVEVAYGSDYTDKGASATDNVDGDISSSITITGEVDTNKAGTYTITYNVSDTAGNRASITRTVIVLPNPEDDANKNGIPDTQEKEWFEYIKETQTATVGPKESTIKSKLKAERVVVTPKIDGNSIILVHTKAYIKATSKGEVSTGFKEGSRNNPTLKTGTFYPLGTTSIITKEDDKIIIETTTKLNKDTTITMGDK